MSRTLFVALVTFATVATAEEPEPRWYGGQIFVADLASVGLFVAAAATESSALSVVGLGTYVLGGPTIHLVHHEVGRGVGSLGLRLGLPTGGALIGLAASSGCEGWFCELGGAGVGALIGMVTASVIDGAVLAHESAPREPPRVSFGIAVWSGRVTAGVGGTF